MVNPSIDPTCNTYSQRLLMPPVDELFVNLTSYDLQRIVAALRDAEEAEDVEDVDDVENMGFDEFSFID